jgi:hypothetical protein
MHPSKPSFLSNVCVQGLLNLQHTLHELPFQKPLTNILSSVEDLNLASVKISEIQEMTDKEQRNLNILKY